jgi:hypothetical protein
MGLVTPRKGFCAWRELLEELSPGHVARLSEFPWYREANINLPVGTTSRAVRVGLASLQGTNEGCCFRGARCEIVETREFNEMVAGGLNKADLLFSVTGRLFLHFWERYVIGQHESGNREIVESETRRRRDAGKRRTEEAGNRGTTRVSGSVPQATLCLYRTADGTCHRASTAQTVCSPRVVVHAGKQGGKTFYSGDLGRLFPSCDVTSIRESPAESAYCVSSPNGAAMLVFFLRDGEERSYELALASLFAKYMRELHMIAFNNYWAKHLPRVFRTTGYHCDANSFLEVALPMLSKLSIPLETLARVR